MKKIIAILILIGFYAIPSFGQTKVDLKFFDSCKDLVVVLNYELAHNDTTILSTNNIATISKKGLYFVSVAVEREGLICYQYFTLPIDDDFKADTLYLKKISPCNSGALHDKDYLFYNCGTIANGNLEERDDSGIVRIKGNFVNGVPKGKLRFYNAIGDLVATETYKRGKLINVE